MTVLTEWGVLILSRAVLNGPCFPALMRFPGFANGMCF